MGIADEASERVVFQRLRNRVREAVEVLADGDDGVRLAGPSEYFELFYDYIDDDRRRDWRSWTSLTAAEIRALEAVLQIVNTAVEATPTVMSEETLITSGWPARIRPVAAMTLAVMSERGLFREDVEEDQPSIHG